MFESLPAYQEDPILDLFVKYQADARPEKVNLGIGIYTDESGKVPVMNAVRIAKERMSSTHPSAYLPPEGMPAYRAQVLDLIFGTDTAENLSSSLTAMQTLGGTGALKLGADFLRDAFPSSRLYVSDPTWVNHPAVFGSAGFEVRTYPYYDAETGRLDLDGMLRSLRELDSNAIVLLHACCHNPTGIDPTKAQWAAIFDVIEERGLLPFFDIAYQGFGRQLDEDAWSIRECVRRNISCVVASSFSKIFSLYGERGGALSIFNSTGGMSKIIGQLKNVVRRSYTAPPAHVSSVVETVLADAMLRAMWEAELETMCARMRGSRERLHATLAQNFRSGEFDFLIEQQGMFSYAPFGIREIDRLRNEFGIYAISSGRICIAGLNSFNLPHVANAFSSVMHDLA